MHGLFLLHIRLSLGCAQGGRVSDVYDIIVVGGGPAGSSAAMMAAKGGAKVLLLEKDPEIGVPVRCAEGVSERSLRSLFESDPPWISNRISKLSFFAPDGTEVRVNSPRIGYILDRVAFDRDLGQKAVEAGAMVWTKACARGLTRSGKDDWEVSVLSNGQPQEVRSRIVIGADGVESRVGRWAGLDTKTPLHDIETCLQYSMQGLDLDPECCQLHFGGDVAPGGYFWIFPKGPGTANVGLGISGEHSRKMKPVDYLNRFISRAYPKGSVLRAVGGGVPCTPPLKEIVSDGLLLVGDAAHQADPMTGGGIMNAVRAGRLAGNVAAEAIMRGDVSKKGLTVYQERCEEQLGKKLRRSYRLKEAVYRLTDKELNDTAKAINRIDPDKRTLGRIILTALTKNQKLLPDIIALFGS